MTARRTGADSRDKPTTAPVRPLPDARDLNYARTQVEDWLNRYVRMSRAWNAPDDEYTRSSAIGFARSIIEEAML